MFFIWHTIWLKMFMQQPFNINGNLEIEKYGECFLNMKRITLLKLIKEKGSINAASKTMKMSYQQAWHFLKQMNELSPLPLIIRKRGGTNGGGAELTRYGEKAIVEFEKLMEKHKAFREELSEKLWLCFF
jgi:molybdate transport system regulatory protein